MGNKPSQGGSTANGSRSNRISRVDLKSAFASLTGSNGGEEDKKGKETTTTTTTTTKTTTAMSQDNSEHDKRKDETDSTAVSSVAVSPDG